MNQSLGLGLGLQSLGLGLGLETQSLGLGLGLVDPSLDYITGSNCMLVITDSSMLEPIRAIFGTFQHCLIPNSTVDEAANCKMQKIGHRVVPNTSYGYY